VENVHFPGTIPSGYLVNTLRRLVETKKWEQRSLDAILILEAQGNTAWVAARMERELLIPIITQTVASVWAAYRSNGIHDRICGMGWLLERF
jgi:maleate cis-trans isomerase